MATSHAGPYFPLVTIGVSFTPREVGEHSVTVKRMGKHIPNSPFKITVGDQEVGDAKKVHVYGETLKEGKTHEENTFNVDTRNAGKAPTIQFVFRVMVTFMGH